jgi:AbrB family looped-hinge helix DNA binding protein
MNVTIDRAGRLVIPKSLRERAGLRPGTELTLEFRDGKIEMEPVRQQVRVARRGSRFVLEAPAGAPPLTVERVNQMLEELREERIRSAGPSHR